MVTSRRTELGRMLLDVEAEQNNSSALYYLLGAISIQQRQGFIFEKSCIGDRRATEYADYGEPLNGQDSEGVKSNKLQ